MRRDKRYIYMDSSEHRLAIIGMNSFRNHLIQVGKPTEVGGRPAAQVAKGQKETLLPQELVVEAHTVRLCKELYEKYEGGKTNCKN